MKTDWTEKSLRFGRREIPYRLQRSARKRLRIVVRPDLSVWVTAPLDQNDEAIQGAVEAKAWWIARKLDSLESFHPLPTPHRYVSGETFLYLGRQYRLRAQAGATMPAKLKGRFLHIQIPDPTDAGAVRAQVDAWYRERANKIFAQSLERCLPIAQRHGADMPTLTIRRMSTRWGSCSRSDRIILNLYLIQAPIHCIDYVVMHELCHMVEHNHSPAYFRLLTRCMPDWKAKREILRVVAVPVSG